MVTSKDVRITCLTEELEKETLKMGQEIKTKDYMIEKLQTEIEDLQRRSDEEAQFRIDFESKLNSLHALNRKME